MMTNHLYSIHPKDDGSMDVDDIEFGIESCAIGDTYRHGEKRAPRPTTMQT